MRISDWSSDVCSSDLWRGLQFFGLREEARVGVPTRPVAWGDRAGEKTRGPAIAAPARGRPFAARPPVDRLPSKAGAGRPRSAGGAARDRKSGVGGQGWAGRVDLGGRGTHKKKKKK